MVAYTLGSSKVLGEEFSDRASKICRQIQDGDTLYLDRVEDAAVAKSVLDAIGKKVVLLPSACNPDVPALPVW